MMITLWGTLTDPSLFAVFEALRRMHVKILFLDQQNYSDTDLDIGIGSDASGTLRLSHDVVDLETIDSIFVRPNDLRQLAETDSAELSSPSWQHSLTVEDILLAWIETMPGLVVNRPSDMTSNGSKPYQMEIIRTVGFNVPETLITTDPSTASRFWQDHGFVIYKSISGIRSTVHRLTDEHRGRMGDIANCPTQFQEYIAGIDYRVHVVGDKIFTCKVVSDADDYRWAPHQGHEVRVSKDEVPDDIADRCFKLATRCNLVVAGIDLRLTPDNEWYCFEVNPSPFFTYYQEASGDKIDEAIAEVLVRGAVS